MSRVLIRNGYVATVDGSRKVYPGGFVLIDGTKIASVGGMEELPGGPFERTIDATGMIVVPGLINAHQHFYYHLFKGLGHGLLLEDWFPQLVFPVLPHLTPEDVRNPHDFPQLVDSPEFNYEDGVLAGFRAAETAIRAARREAEDVASAAESAGDARGARSDGSMDSRRGR